MKGVVLLFASFATECYSGHSTSLPRKCKNSIDCGENEFFILLGTVGAMIAVELAPRMAKTNVRRHSKNTSLNIL